MFVQSKDYPIKQCRSINETLLRVSHQGSINTSKSIHQVKIHPKRIIVLCQIKFTTFVLGTRHMTMSKTNLDQDY